jgi:hypothetical protein
MTTLTFVLPTLSFFIWLLGTLVLASVIHVGIHRLILGKRAS